MKRKNDGEMNFKRVCKCSKHDEWGQPPLIVLSNKKNYRANVVASMKEEKYLTSHANFLCIYCYDTFRNQIGDGKSFKNESIYISLSKPTHLHRAYVSMKICEYPPPGSKAGVFTPPKND